MYVTYDQIQRAYGFLLLNDSNKFIYCCKQCLLIFDSSIKLEAHILLEDHDKKTDIEGVFLTGVLETVSDEQPSCIKNETAGTETIIVKIEPEVKVERKAEDNSLTVQRTSTHGTRSSEIYSVPRHSKVNIIDDKPAHSASSQSIPKKKLTKFTSKIRLKKKTGRSSGPFYCDSCPDITFHCKDNLRQHMKRHTQRKVRQICDICQKTPKNYDKHMRIYHLEAKPYKCDFQNQLQPSDSYANAYG